MRTFLTLVCLCLIQAVSLAQKSRKTSGNYTQSAGVTLSLPWVNGYALYDYEIGKTTNKAGFAGLGLAFYYKKNKSKWSLNTGVTADLPAPLGPIDYGKEGSRWSISNQFVEMNFHHAIYKRIWGIAGGNFVNYRYFFIDYDNNLDYTRHNSTMGLTAGLEYVSKKSFALAVFYRPALVSFQKKQHWHMLSLDVRFDLPVWKRK